MDIIHCWKCRSVDPTNSDCRSSSSAPFYWRCWCQSSRPIRSFCLRTPSCSCRTPQPRPLSPSTPRPRGLPSILPCWSHGRRCFQYRTYQGRPLKPSADRVPRVRHPPACVYKYQDILTVGYENQTNSVDSTSPSLWFMVILYLGTTGTTNNYF